MTRIFSFFVISILLTSCNSSCRWRQETEDLIIYTPPYSRIDLICDNIPTEKDTTIQFCAAAAFTGKRMEEFTHSNIAGDHVSTGVRQVGYKCDRNTGTFVWYNNRYRFLLQKNADQHLDSAAKFGGMAFSQEALIIDGKKAAYKRPDNNKNEFRALCEKNKKLCIIDSNGSTRFGFFVQKLLSYGVENALYLDMGSGWNYSFYRDDEGKIQNIHGNKCKYNTNWIVFYK